MHMPKIGLNYYPKPYTEFNLRQTADLNIRVETLTLLEESIGENPNDLGYAKMFYLGHKINQKGKNIDKIIFLTMKMLCSSKITIKKMKS